MSFRRSPLGIAISGLVVLALVGFGIFRLVDKVSSTASEIGSDSSSGGGDSDSLYRPANFGKALDAVRAKVGVGGDVLEIRIEAKKADFSVRQGKSEEAEGWRATAGESDLESFPVDVVGNGTLAASAIPVSDVTAASVGRIEAAIAKRDLAAKLATYAFFDLTMDATSGKPEWKVNAHSMLYLAKLNGTGVHTPGE